MNTHIHSLEYVLFSRVCLSTLTYIHFIAVKLCVVSHSNLLSFISVILPAIYLSTLSLFFLLGVQNMEGCLASVFHKFCPVELRY